MKKNLLCVVLCFCILISILLGACAPAEPSAMEQSTSGSIPGEEVNTKETSSNPVQIIPLAGEKYVTWSGEEDFNALYATASKEKQEKLNAFMKEYKDFYNRERQIRVIMGELSENAPRLTLEQAEEVLKKIDATDYESAEEYIAEVVRQFNTIHGYPDVVRRGDGYVLEYFFEGHCELASNMLYVVFDRGIVKYAKTGGGVVTKYIAVYTEQITANTPPEGEDFLDQVWYESNWDMFYEMATAEQKEKLDALKAEEPEMYKKYAKRIFIIMGILPENTPHATLELVKTVLEEMKKNKYRSWDERYLDFQRRMNVVCGYADDCDTLSDDLVTHGAVYYLNDEGTEWVFYRAYGKVDYYNDETGVKEQLAQF